MERWHEFVRKHLTPDRPRKCKYCWNAWWYAGDFGVCELKMWSGELNYQIYKDQPACEHFEPKPYLPVQIITEFIDACYLVCRFVAVLIRTMMLILRAALKRKIQGKMR